MYKSFHFSIFISSFIDLSPCSCFSVPAQTPPPSSSSIVVVVMWLVDPREYLVCIESDLWPLQLYGIPYMVCLRPADLQLCSGSVGWKAACAAEQRAASKNQQVKGWDTWKWGDEVWSAIYRKSHNAIILYTQWCMWETEWEWLWAMMMKDLLSFAFLQNDCFKDVSSRQLIRV